jgi:hypothetical protein
VKDEIKQWYEYLTKKKSGSWTSSEADRIEKVQEIEKAYAAMEEKKRQMTSQQSLNASLQQSLLYNNPRHDAFSSQQLLGQNLQMQQAAEKSFLQQLASRPNLLTKTTKVETVHSPSQRVSAMLQVLESFARVLGGEECKPEYSEAATRYRLGSFEVDAKEVQAAVDDQHVFEETLKSMLLHYAEIAEKRFQEEAPKRRRALGGGARAPSMMPKVVVEESHG